LQVLDIMDGSNDVEQVDDRLGAQADGAIVGLLLNRGGQAARHKDH